MLKMFKKMIFCVLLLAISTVQAFPASDVEPQKKQLNCAEKRAWYGDVMNNTKEVYDAYNTKINEAKLPSDILDKLSIENTKFENSIAEMLKLYKNNSEKRDSISDSVVKLSFCMSNIEKYRELNVNLTALAVNLKSNVSNILNNSAVPKEVRDNLGKMLNKTVNFLYISDMTENQYKDVKSLVIDASTQTEKGIALETEYEFNEDGKLQETDEKVEEEYKDLLENDESDKEFEDESERADEIIKAERAKNVDDSNEDGGYYSLGFGIATLAVILLSILVGSVLVWVRSHSYTRFS